MAAKYADEHLALPADYHPRRIGVVTVLYSSGAVLDDFFTSIERQTYKDFVVYCVDNGSTDESVARCRARGECYVVIENGKNLGVPAANNIGTRAAIADGCDFVLFLNNDVEFGPELFRQLVDNLDQYDCAMTAPIMYYHDRPEVIWAAGGHFQQWLGYRCLHYGDGDADVGQYEGARPVQFAPTCCVLVKRELFAKIGMMDERYFVYFDDTDFMLRSYLAGEVLYLLPDVKLWHKVSSMIGTASPLRTYYSHRNHALYGHKHLPAVFAYLISFFYCSVYLLQAVVGRTSFAQARDRIRFWREGMRVARMNRVDLIDS